MSAAYCLYWLDRLSFKGKADLGEYASIVVACERDEEIGSALASGAFSLW